MSIVPKQQPQSRPGCLTRRRRSPLHRLLESLVEGAISNLKSLKAVREVDIPNDVSPPYHFSPLVPGMQVDRVQKPITLSPAPPALNRPDNLEDLAFWPARHLAALVEAQQVTSVELTSMYLERLHRYNPLLNNVVTFLDDHAIAEASAADREIAAGKYRGPLHGLPWGAKDIISLKDYPTTWGSEPFKDQVSAPHQGPQRQDVSEKLLENTGIRLRVSKNDEFCINNEKLCIKKL